MSLEVWPKFDTNGLINVYDGGSASIIGVPYLEGDFKVSGLMPICNEMTEAAPRGLFMGVGYGDATFPSVTITERLAQMIATSAPGPLRDFLTQTGAYAANVSTFGAGRPRAVHLEYVVKGTDIGDADDTLKLFNVAFPAYDFAAGRPNSHSWTGKVYGQTGASGIVATINGTTVCRRISANGF